MSQICTISFFHFSGFKNRWWAFAQMGKRVFLSTTPSVKAVPTFVKMFGAGSGNGFSLMPDFGIYGMLSVWNNRADAEQFFKENSTFKTYQNQAKEIFTVFLQPIMAHGQWDKVAPFTSQKVHNLTAPMAVLTRGTVKSQYIFDFLRFTRTASRSMENAVGRIFSIGIGEVPITQQATFSIWRDAEAMKEYAYKNPHHTEVIKKTRELGWYSEELFARFEVLDMYVWGENFEKKTIPLTEIEDYFKK